MPYRRTGNPNGRPPGSVSKKPEFDRIVERLAKAGKIDRDEAVLKLYQKAIEGEPTALRLWITMNYGAPRRHVDVQHEIGPNWTETLRRIAADEDKRRRLEELETRRLRLAAVTTEVVSDS